LRGANRHRSPGAEHQRVHSGGLLLLQAEPGSGLGPGSPAPSGLCDHHQRERYLRLGSGQEQPKVRCGQETSEPALGGHGTDAQWERIASGQCQAVRERDTNPFICLFVMMPIAFI